LPTDESNPQGQAENWEASYGIWRPGDFTSRKIVNKDGFTSKEAAHGYLFEIGVSLPRGYEIFWSDVTKKS